MEIVEVPVVVDGQLRHVEQGRQPFNLLRLDRMLDNHDGVVNVAALNKVVLEKILNLMEEDESTARPYLGRVVGRLVPVGGLNSKNP